MTATFEPGARFPDLELRDGTGRPTRLGEAMGGEAAVVFFLRNAACPVCRNHLKTLAKRQGDIKANRAKVISVVPDGPEEARELETWLGLPVPVLTSATGSHAEAGLEPRFWGKLQPSGTVLLAPSREVVYGRQSALPPLGFNEKELMTALARGAHRPD
ncbi:redoxin domain-containing protein [Corallococcus caeni]|uniref:Peroxiredoxin family protein n=1 Tax=Corallococcus caeni TaxID=3082388 RepID=A0ABQ6QQ96_9BACT|nr:peroxiredoxin family protein [Corallococcus sp. NO1]